MGALLQLRDSKTNRYVLHPNVQAEMSQFTPACVLGVVARGAQYGPWDASPCDL